MEISEIFDRVAGFVALDALRRDRAAAAALPLAAARRGADARLDGARARAPGAPTSRPARRSSTAPRPSSRSCVGPRAGEPTPARDAGDPDPGRDPGHARAPGARADHDGAGGARAASALAPVRRAARPSPGCWSRSAIVALVLGVAAIFASEELLERRRRRASGPRAGAIDRGDVTVAVLNGTSVNGLAGQGRLRRRVERLRARAGDQHRPRASRRPSVLYADGQKRAAQKVAQRPRRRQADGRARRPRVAAARRRRRRRRDRRRGQGQS